MFAKGSVLAALLRCVWALFDHDLNCILFLYTQWVPVLKRNQNSKNCWSPKVDFTVYGSIADWIWIPSSTTWSTILFIDRSVPMRIIRIPIYREWNKRCSVQPLRTTMTSRLMSKRWCQTVQPKKTYGPSSGSHSCNVKQGSLQEYSLRLARWILYASSPFSAFNWDIIGSHGFQHPCHVANLGEHLSPGPQDTIFCASVISAVGGAGMENQARTKDAAGANSSAGIMPPRRPKWPKWPPK